METVVRIHTNQKYKKYCDSRAVIEMREAMRRAIVSTSNEMHCAFTVAI